MENSLLKSVDARTRLAGSNKLELLLFKLESDQPGRQAEVFGINVFKVQEVIMTPAITALPDSPPHVVGMASLRGEIVSIIDLIGFCGKPSKGIAPTMIITEFSRHIQAFLVHSVETIVRIDWSEIHQPPAMLGQNSKVTSVTQLPDGRLVSILDVEQVMQSIGGPVDLPSDLADAAVEIPEYTKVFFADDSAFARAQLQQVLDAVGVKNESAVNGAEAWRRLEAMAGIASAAGNNLADTLPVIITDLEMPEMDGFMLTKRIREDKRFSDVKILVHSSMSNSSNLEKAKAMGADGFLSKFSPTEIAAQLREVLARRHGVLPMAA